MLNHCVICNSKNIKKIADYPRTSQNKFYTEIIYCDDCLSGIALPYRDQTELNAFYGSGEYWEHLSSPQLNIHTLTQAKARVQYVINKAKLHQSSLNVLDVGAGHGHIAMAFQLLKFKSLKKYFFIEPDPVLSKSILSRFNKAEKMEFGETSKSYELIFLNHVLEHTADPVETLKTYVNQLVQDGIVYIEIPHRDDQFKGDVFPHSIFFSKKGLQEMIERAGLQCIEINSFGSLESIREPGSILKKIRIKFLSRLFAISVKYNLNKVAQFFDKHISGYNSLSDDGIWLRAICSRK